MRPVLRLIADDLTGALDSAAQFTGLAGPVAVHWRVPAAEPQGAFVLDTGTREKPAQVAARMLRALAPLIRPAPGHIAFFKLDSLLRGNAGAELSAILSAMPGTRCLIAPAFPHQGRIMRDGRQCIRKPDSSCTTTGEDLATTMRKAGLTVHNAKPGTTIPPGISLWDAANDAELHAIATAGLALDDDLLWCGSAGLAGALADVLNASPVHVPEPLPRPVLGLFGSRHPVLLGQLAAADDIAVTHTADLAPIRDRLAQGAILVSFPLPDGTAREAATAAITNRMRIVLDALPRPASLIISGGETLRALCEDIGVTHLEATGQFEPGIPRLVFRGGAWDGVIVIAKSGAFGAPDLLARLAGPSSQGTAQP